MIAVRHTFPFVRIALVILLAAALSFVGCEPEPSGPVDQAFAAPVLSEFVSTPLVVDTDSIFVGPDRLPDDQLSISVQIRLRVQDDPLAPVTFAISAVDPFGSELPLTGSIHDDGVLPDSTSGDGIYRGTIVITVGRTIIGSCYIRLDASNGNGLRSNAVLLPLTLTRSNLPPSLLEVIADTSVSHSSGSTTLLLQAKVSDPNGLADIRRVWFDSFLPSGAPSSGNPFQLFDDGNTAGISGDLIAGDGTYSLTVQFQGAPVGVYQFHFRTVDRSLDSSNTIVHSVSVNP